MSHLRVCIDGIPLLLRSAGVKTHLYYWIRELQAQTQNGVVRVFPFLTGMGNCDHERSIRGPLGTYARIAYFQAANYLAPWILRPLGWQSDIFHCSNQLRVPPRNTKVTATVFDLTCWTVPEMHSPANVEATKIWADAVVKPAAAVIANSEHTRRDAIEILGLHPDRVHAISPGVAEAFYTVTEFEARAAAQRHGLLRPYVLFVGTIEPRKNLPGLLDAWSRVPQSGDVDLVVIGPSGWGDQSVVARMATEKNVRYLGYVDEADLAPLTRSATVLAYPSHYEGFGLPLAQAMACGVPVVTSNVTSLPEVAGDAALLVEPQSAGQIAAALTRLLDSPDLRADLGQRGKRRAELYRWSVVAEQSWRFFEKVAGQA